MMIYVMEFIRLREKSVNKMETITLGVSSCLLGEKVRFDSGHKRNAYVVKTLGQYFRFLPVCPEMAIGLGTPRPTLRLLQKGQSIRLVRVKDPSYDVTQKMLEFADAHTLQLSHLCGYILKKDSPSCGMERVRVYEQDGNVKRRGRGLFADRLTHHHPNLPVEEEGRLMDAVLRENFIERVFVYYRWQQLITSGMCVDSLMQFHRRHKFSLLAHDEQKFRQLGPLVASANADNLVDVSESYISQLMQSMQKRASRKRHANVLQHIMGFLKKVLTADDKQELNNIIDLYRLGRVPLIVPITLLRHHLRKAPNPYIEEQYYMAPYPEELMLRNTL